MKDNNTSKNINSDKVKTFLEVAGQGYSCHFATGTEQERALGAKLLLSEVLEYVIQGLGVIPEVNGVKITEPNGLKYIASDSTPDRKEMLDGLADVAYTMFWNSVKFGIPLETAYDLVCDNNLSKFVIVAGTEYKSGILPKSDWHLGQNVTWPDSVTTVEVVEVNGIHYAAGKDSTGKVQKPSTYKSVVLDDLL